MRAARPIDFVTALQAQTDGAEMSFHPHSRVKDAAHIVCAKVLHGSRKLSEGRGLGIQLEIDEASLERKKRPDRVTGSNECESAKPVQNFQVAVRHADGAARAHTALHEPLIEVVAYFSFEHDVRERFVAHPPSQSRHVCPRLSDPEINAVGAYLKLILCLRLRHKPACPC